MDDVKILHDGQGAGARSLRHFNGDQRVFRLALIVGRDHAALGKSLGHAHAGLERGGVGEDAKGSVITHLPILSGVVRAHAC